MTNAAFNLKQKSTGHLYKKCICGCGENTTTATLFASAEEAMKYVNYAKLDGWFPTVYIDDSWKKRELQKFSNGQYQPCVWQDEKWYTDAKEKVFDKFFPHISLTNTSVIAFTETPEKGMQDIQTPIKPGKFLQRFFGKVLSADEITEWANRHTEEWAKGPQLKLASTPEEITAVYEMNSGFTSCMQKPVNHFEPLINPTRVYANGDLKLGYITDKSGKLLARALVWPEKKKVGRIYGDDYRFRAAVKETLGFETKSNNGTYDTFAGAKLERIEYENGFVVPYIDGQAYIADMGDHLVINGQSGSRVGEAHNQNGIMAGGGKTCARCAQPIKKRYHRVITNSSRLDHHDRWCASCWANYGLAVEHEGNTLKVYREAFKRTIVAEYNKDGSLYQSREVIEAFLDKSKYVKDIFSGYYIAKDMSVMVNGDKAVHVYAFKNALKKGTIYQSELNGEFFWFDGYNDYAPTTVDGQIWTREQASMYAKYDEKTMKFARLPNVMSTSDNLFTKEQERV
jgi:hypothetical protein